MCPTTIQAQQSVLVNSSLIRNESIYVPQATRYGSESCFVRRAIVSTRISRIRRYHCVRSDNAAARWLPAITAIVSIFPRFRLSHGIVHSIKERERERRQREKEDRDTTWERDGSRDSFHINNGGSSITSGGGNGRYAETEKGARRLVFIINRLSPGWSVGLFIRRLWIALLAFPGSSCVIVDALYRLSSPRFMPISVTDMWNACVCNRSEHYWCTSTNANPPKKREKNCDRFITRMIYPRLNF